MSRTSPGVAIIHLLEGWSQFFPAEHCEIWLLLNYQLWMWIHWQIGIATRILNYEDDDDDDDDDDDHERLGTTS